MIGQTLGHYREIWTAIKTIPTWQQDIVADIQVPGGPAAAAAPAVAATSAGRTYTVKAGDTLGGIAKEHLGSAGAYMKIFDLNKDVLTDPDKIKTGRVLRLPYVDPREIGTANARLGWRSISHVAGGPHARHFLGGPVTQTAAFCGPGSFSLARGRSDL